MNREKKFRAWDGEKMITKSRRDGYDDYYTMDLDGSFYGHTRTGDEYFSYAKDECNQKQYILMQYTGLKDKNGKEIYFKCDIVKIKYPYCGTHIELVVVFNFNEEEQRTELDIYGHHQYTSLWYDSTKMKDIEIIGNIYEHPNLNGNF